MALEYKAWGDLRPSLSVHSTQWHLWPYVTSRAVESGHLAARDAAWCAPAAPPPDSWCSDVIWCTALHLLHHGAGAGPGLVRGPTPGPWCSLSAALVI